MGARDDSRRTSEKWMPHTHNHTLKSVDVGMEVGAGGLEDAHACTHTSAALHALQDTPWCRNSWVGLGVTRAVFMHGDEKLPHGNSMAVAGLNLPYPLFLGHRPRELANFRRRRRKLACVPMRNLSDDTSGPARLAVIRKPNPRPNSCKVGGRHRGRSAAGPPAPHIGGPMPQAGGNPEVVAYSAPEFLQLVSPPIVWLLRWPAPWLQAVFAPPTVGYNETYDVPLCRATSPVLQRPPVPSWAGNRRKATAATTAMSIRPVHPQRP